MIPNRIKKTRNYVTFFKSYVTIQPLIYKKFTVLELMEIEF